MNYAGQVHVTRHSGHTAVSVVFHRVLLEFFYVFILVILSVLHGMV